MQDIGEERSVVSSRIIRSLRTVFTLSHLAAFVVISKVAPDPYIDETFHIPQCQAYCHGNFMEWNDKITTPPGLYLVSYVIAKVGEVCHVPIDLCSTTELRLLNIYLVCVMLPSITRRIYRRIHPDASRDAVRLAALFPAFPLLSFFGNLYYTDVLSTTAVLYCYLLAMKNKYKSSAIVGVLAMLTRQTNIVWVAFIMAVSLIRRLKEVDIVELDEDEEPTSQRAWILFDPLAAEARFPYDYLIAVRQCVLAFMAHTSALLPILLSYLPLFISFVSFLIWNQGIVLGDKSNHIAGINVPQLLYCGTFIAGFGAPLVLSFALIRHLILYPFTSFTRALKVGVFLGFLLVIVHYNTIEHLFLTADNRHFVFYIWRRTIKRHYLAKYFAVPVYYACGWLVLTMLSFSQSALFVLGFIASTALTIVPSPLLEFRYFVLPYLFWRLHLSPSIIENARWRGILEYLSYETINLVTLWIFITRPFVWDSESGKTQRFIW